jgi:hypothetical protein
MIIQKRTPPLWCHLLVKKYCYGKRDNTLTDASSEGVGQGRCGRILFNYENWQRKKLIIKPINFILVFIPSQLNRPQNDGIVLPPRSALAARPFFPLLCHA